MSTMVDAFIDDTQMLDYQSDLDVPMNAHSSDSWIQEEEIMEEDSLHSHKQDHPLFFSHKSTFHQVSEHGISRPEMQSIEEEPHHLHSQMQSQSTSVVETVSQTYHTTAHHMHDDDQLPHSGMQSESFIALENAEDLRHVQTRGQKATVMDTGDGSIEVDMELFPEYEMLDDDEELDVEVYDASLVHSSAPPEVYSSHPFDESKNEPLSVELPEGIQESSAENAFGEQSEVPSLESFSPEKQQSLHFADGDTSASETVIINEAEVTEDGDMTKVVSASELDQEPDNTIQVFSVTAKELEGHNAHSGDVNPNFEEDTDDHEGSNVLEHEPEVEQADLSAHSTGDPHEISEGVYIDPPPAVVLLVSTEVQHHFSLFNEPQEESSSTIQVILQHRPTLYYEPLHSVFEAFRQEEHLHTLFDSTNAELTLDAYELQLIVSEDNFYAREVTLHDLNILHDAAGIHGPLRLRLTATSPRFIVHYRRLQERVSNLIQGEAVDALTFSVVEEHNEENDDSQTSSSRNHNELPEDKVNQLEEGEHQDENITRIPTPNEQDNLEHSAPPNDFADPATPLHLSGRYSEFDTEGNATEKYATVVKSLGDDNNESERHDDEEGAKAGDSSGEAEESVAAEESGEVEESGEAEEEEYATTTSLLPEENASQHGDEDELHEPTIEGGQGHQDLDQNVTSGELDTYDNQLENGEGVEAYEESSELQNLPFPADGTDDGALLVGTDDWDDSLDGEGELDTAWDIEQEQDLASNGSSNTLSSKASKRGFEEVDPDFGDDVEDVSPPISPDPKRLRIQ